MSKDLLLSAYSYHLPPEHIAQHPADRRDNSRLLVLHTEKNVLQHQRFSDLGKFISPGDMLVVNNTRVFPARLLGKKETGGKAEVFLLELPSTLHTGKGQATCTALIKSSKRPKEGTKIYFADSFSCTVSRQLDDGKAELRLVFPPALDLNNVLQQHGQVPLPPYISRESGTTPEDTTRYQTVYASHPGAVAAPTAGLHFTDEMLTNLTSKGVQIGSITLHVGYGTFAPVREEDITRHRIHHEYITIPEETVTAIHKTKERGNRVWAVGTTTVRALEFGAAQTGRLTPFSGWCDLYIYPGYSFKVIDNLITNFHLPDSSLMFLVAALCGRKTLLDSYSTAIEKGYRFFSYGDAMAIITSTTSGQ